MFKEQFIENKKPKSFHIKLPRPASKKFTISKDGNLVDINIKDYTITIDNKPILWVNNTIEWDDSWSWSDFDSKSGKRIEKMIKYLKGN